MNKIIKWMFRPILNLVDVLIYGLVIILGAQIGLWVFIPAIILTFLNALFEKKIGWEVFNNSRD